MRTGLLLISIFTFLFTACVKKKRSAQDDTVETAPVADSAIVASYPYADRLFDLSSSRNITQLLCQGWELEDDLDAIENNDDAEGILPFRSFYFSPDSTYIRNPRNAMEYGRWQYDDASKKITLKSNSGSKDEYKIAAIGSTDLVVVNSGIGSVTKLRFISPGKQFKNSAYNPYHIDNNRWRIKPRNPETDQQIRERLKACIHFYILLYSYHLAKGDDNISFYGFPTCIKWYAGGIYMVKKDDLKEGWFHCFYNGEQAMKAYNMMDEVMGKKYKWSKEKISWIQKNLQVLEQMYSNL